MSDSIVRVPGGAQTGNVAKAAPRSNDVTLTIAGKIWSGWTEVRIGRGVERFPSDFEVKLTERYPGEAGVLMAEPGRSVVVRIGTDVVLTGVIDRYLPSIAPAGHDVRIQGRSRCRALVDCSAGVLPNGAWQTQVASSSILSIVRQLANPFGITVTSLSDATLKLAPQFNVNLGETVGEIIERVSRWGGLLYYDDVQGNLVLAQVGAHTMASGFAQGVNIEAASATYTADQRFSDYIVVWMSVDGLSQVRAGSDGSTNGNTRAVVKDTSQPSQGFRPHVIVSEQVDQDSDFAQTRAVWEMNRRNGRARAVTLTTDGWRDSAGALWTPNALVPVDVPLLKVAKQRWIIGEVTYRLDASGTHADLTLMPPQAYTPEPYNLQPLDRQIVQALAEGGAQKDTPRTSGRRDLD